MKFNFVGVKIDQFAHFQENHHQKERDEGLAATNLKLQAAEVAMPPSMHQISERQF